MSEGLSESEVVGSRLQRKVGAEGEERSEFVSSIILVVANGNLDSPRKESKENTWFRKFSKVDRWRSSRFASELLER
jgi:hypothetical protein